MFLRYGILYVVLALFLFSPLLAGQSLGPVRSYLGSVALILAILYWAADDCERRTGRVLRRPDMIGRILRIWLIPHGVICRLILWRRGRGAESAADEVLPGLLLGRRPMGPDRARYASLGAIVDLCAEFPPSGREAGLAALTRLDIPVMDGGAPSLAELGDAVRFVERHLAEGRTVLVHCAAGHGRSATVVAGVLAYRGLVAEARAAEAYMQRMRPRVRLTGPQRKQLEKFIQSGSVGGAGTAPATAAGPPLADPRLSPDDFRG